jgi:flagellar biosynthesis/type III secretory pathway M-ring protein FliF/YscJ
LISIFAQTTEYTPPQIIGPWLECLFWFVAFIAACVITKHYIWPPKEKKNGMPQPMVVTKHPTFADKDETDQRFKHLEVKIEASRVENKTEMEKLRVEAVDGRRLLHKDIEALGKEIGDRIYKFSVETINSVGELRGELRRMK